jgi:hypothetical protein
MACHIMDAISCIDSFLFNTISMHSAPAVLGTVAAVHRAHTSSFCSALLQFAQFRTLHDPPWASLHPPSPLIAAAPLMIFFKEKKANDCF